jgi:hypothetical protein
MAENFTALYKPIVTKMWDPRRLTTLWDSTACYRDNFTFTFNYFDLNYVFTSLISIRNLVSSFRENREQGF